MKFPIVPILTAIMLCSFGIVNAASSSVQNYNPRTITLFDRNWLFHLGDSPGADHVAFDDSSWRALNLPHDWSIEGPVGADPTKMDGPFDRSSPAGAGGAYLNGGVGWYRKSFTLPSSLSGRQFTILFEGAYMDSDVWINGHHLGNHPYGYTSFYYDLAPYLTFGAAKNEISVRLEVDQPCSRWYSGAGLYRNVWLTATTAVHVAQWGTYVTTPTVIPADAQVAVQTQVENDKTTPVTAILKTILYNPSGAAVGMARESQLLTPGSTTPYAQSVNVSNPRLWSVDSPVLYTADSEVWVNGHLADSVRTPFGIRTIQFTTDNGFLLNGQHVELHGVCDHGDLGCLGTVALRRGLQRQLEILKGMGCNAIRTSHNPPSPQFLDLCDQMGFLVMDESFDEWKLDKTKNGYGQYFDQWSQPDLISMLHRDRNHPSIIIWSVGNEVTEGFISGGAATAKSLVDTCHREDPTRPVTSACQQPPNSLRYGFDKAFDVFGINYSAQTYQDARAHGVEPLVGSETASQVDTRGEYGLQLDASGDVEINDLPRGQVSSYDRFRPGWATAPETEEIDLQNAPWVAGEFVWTGFDYLGEPTPFGWPSRSSYFGINDLCGFPKDRYYFYKSQWTSQPLVHIMPHWTWPGFEGKSIPVRVFTNADTVELFLNGKSLGVQHWPADCEQLDGPLPKVAAGTVPPPPVKIPTLHLEWSVPYEPGTLKAVASKNGVVVAVDQVQTAGDPARIILTPDRTSIAGDGLDLSFITVTVVDASGVPCPNASNEITYALTGAAARIAGLDNGDPTNHEHFQGTSHSAFHGLALAVLQSLPDSHGPVVITATSPGLVSGVSNIEVQYVSPLNEGTTIAAR